MPLDPLELAWAAGFFDGEGSTVARTFARRPGYRQVLITVPQAGDGVPEVLLRFQAAMAGLGTIAAPNSGAAYQWRVSGREHVRVVLDLLWPYLGDVKKHQAVAARELVARQYESGRYRARAPRSKRVEVVVGRPPSADLVERAWAAGFLGAEGCFGLNRSGERVRGPDWYRVRVSASQHGMAGEPAAVLDRLRRVLGGRVERHGDPDDYKWLVEGGPGVRRVFDLVAPWLDAAKTADAKAALTTFDGQVRLRGTATRCARGHPYSYETARGGRVRKICRACARLLDRRSRARRGIAPRQFQNVERRYTE